MDLAKFISLLSREELYFACPSEFGDPYEGLYPKSHMQAFSSLAQNHIDQAIVTRDELIIRRPGIDALGLNKTIETMGARLIEAHAEVRFKFGITCWHSNQTESEAMWKLYSTLGQGIAIESTSRRLEDSLADKSSLQIDRVRYVDFENDPIEKGHENYGLFLKRKSFEHERELRATILLKEQGKGEFAKCNLDILIKKVHVSPFAPAYFKDVIDSLCGGRIRLLDKPISKSSLFEVSSNDYALKLDMSGIKS